MPGYKEGSMFELIQRIPEPWRQLADLLVAPLAWIPRMQHTLWDFFFADGPLWLVAAKFLFLLFPALLAVAAVWCTQLSIYTLPFRSVRARSRHLHLYPDADRDRAPRRPRRWRVDDALHGPHPLLLPAAARHG